MKTSLTTLLIFFQVFTFAQRFSSTPSIYEHLKDSLSAWQMTQDDIRELVLSSSHFDKRSATQYYYIQQYANGYPIYNAISTIIINEEKSIAKINHRFHQDILKKTNSTRPQISSLSFLQKNSNKLKLQATFDARPKKNDSYIYENGACLSPIKTKLIYFPKGNILCLAWQITLERKADGAALLIIVDATDGNIIYEKDLVLHCNPQAEESSYNVIHFQAENPLTEAPSLVENPCDPIASPYGWHDTDGVLGAEYTITKGNNAHAYQDRDGDNTSSNDEPNGGSSLDFVTSFDLLQEPENYTNASVAQAFYSTNIAHDIFFHYGFTPETGNFQYSTYGREGAGEDPIDVLCQHQADVPPITSGQNANRNNASFFSGFEDGDKGRMRLLLWTKDAASQEYLTITSPSTIAGKYNAGVALFGPELTDIPLTAEFIAPTPSDACSDLTEDLTGKIAIVDRGFCDFSFKVKKTQEQGAIACIVCNYTDDIINMAGGIDADQVQIPSIFLGATDCNIIKNMLGSQVIGSLAVPFVEGPDALDSSFDNGLVFHEIAHGLSNRLTGGRSTTFCLDNQEQMGEGWSDYFAIALTTNPNNFTSQSRSIANYLDRSGINGTGIRRYPYSPDLSINPLTYDDIITATIPHGVGTVWGAMLWDIHQAFVAEYGYDPDLYQGEGGNNKAIQLIIDALKIQPCNPGFIDARDAIFLADEINNNGIHHCLLWEVFARRGLGVNALQYDPNNRSDGVPSFDSPLACIPTLKIIKEQTLEIQAGEMINFSILIRNDSPTDFQNLIVTDTLDFIFEFENQSAPSQLSFSKTGQLLSWQIPSLASGDSMRINYTATSLPDFASRIFYQNTLETELEKDDWETLANWTYTSLLTHSGSTAVYVPNNTQEGNAFLLSDAQLLDYQKPTLSFWHYYETSPALVGGVVELSEDNGNTWIDLGDAIFQAPYRGKLSPLVTSPDTPAYWGNAGNWVKTYIDLGAYANKSVLIRFRLLGAAASEANGWYIDDIFIFDMENSHRAACVMTSAGSRICDYARARGTKVFPVGTISQSENDGFSVTLFPNPANELLELQINGEDIKGQIQVTLYNTKGQKMTSWEVQKEFPLQRYTFSLNSQLLSGIYILEIRSDNALLSKKLFIQKG